MGLNTTGRSGGGADSSDDDSTTDSEPRLIADGGQQEVTRIVEKEYADIDEEVDIDKMFTDDDELREDWYEQLDGDNINPDLEETYHRERTEELVRMAWEYERADMPEFDNERDQLLHKLKEYQKMQQNVANPDFTNEELADIAVKMARIEKNDRNYQEDPVDDEKLSPKQMELVINSSVINKEYRDGKTNKDIREPVIKSLGYSGEPGANNNDSQPTFPAQATEMRAIKDVDDGKASNNEMNVNYNMDEYENVRVCPVIYDATNSEGNNGTIAGSSVITSESLLEDKDVKDKISNTGHISNELVEKATSNTKPAESGEVQYENGLLISSDESDIFDDEKGHGLEKRDKPNTDITVRETSRKPPESVMSQEELCEKLNEDIVGREVDLSDQVKQGDYTHYHVLDSLGIIDENNRTIDEISGENIDQIEDDSRAPDVLSELVEVKSNTSGDVNYGIERPTDTSGFEHYETELSPSSNRYLHVFVDEKEDDADTGEITGFLMYQGKDYDKVSTRDINTEVRGRIGTHVDDRLELRDLKEAGMPIPSDSDADPSTIPEDWDPDGNLRERK